MSGVSVASPGYIEPRTYLSELYALGVKDYTDAIGYHAYTYPEQPVTGNEKNAWIKIQEAPNNLRSIMVKNGDSSKKIWITEYGAPTNGKGDGADNAKYSRTTRTDHVTEEYQAVLAENAISLYQESDWIQSMYWYTWQDKGTKQDTSENFFGLTDFNKRQKPAFAVFEKNKTEKE